MLWTLSKKILFSLPPETSHALALNALKFFSYFPFFKKKYSYPVTVMGIEFENPIGLAAGLDKNGDYIDSLGQLGFGFLEIGTVTPRAQSGNPRPRLFRFPKQKVLINRMGFNNKGVDYLVERLKRKKYSGVLGVNIGKNADTPLEKAVDDYLECFNKVAAYAHYVTINISSPNTKNLRELEKSEWLEALLRALKQQQKQFFETEKKYVPLIVKVSPDLSRHEAESMMRIFIQYEIDGVIATNTTINHAEVSDEAGGMSGKLLSGQSGKILNAFSMLQKNNQIPLIGCGGIFTKEDVEEKFKLGASLVQVYTGFIFQGPEMLTKLI
ncbi:MAG: dihydroorotate dehydrogenase (quinone) [Gammaproteobacteria bacterium]|nr:dihydroorotate dehydrogenase (quinone) [Gammaproteobacteria bacterium]